MSEYTLPKLFGTFRVGDMSRRASICLGYITLSIWTVAHQQSQVAQLLEQPKAKVHPS